MRSPRPKFQNHLVFITFHNRIFVILSFEIVWPWRPRRPRKEPSEYFQRLHFWNQFFPLIKMHYRVRYSLDFDPKIRSGQVCVRVANVVADHNSLLTQWRPIKMSKFRANIFLIRTTSNYFWASEVFKNQKFKSHLISFFQYKKYPKLKTWVSFYAIVILYY